MTLTEYLNQENPVKMPYVVLNYTEYEVHSRSGIKPYRLFEVYIPKIGYTYVAREGQTNLYTQNQFGAPKSLSCFVLDCPIS